MKLKIQSTYKTRRTGDHLNPSVAQDVIIRIQSAYLVTEVIDAFGRPGWLPSPAEWYYLLTYEIGDNHGTEFYPESMLFSNDPEILNKEITT